MNKGITASFQPVQDDSDEKEVLQNRLTKRLLAVEEDDYDTRRSMRRSRRSKRATRSMLASSMISAEGHDYIPLVDQITMGPLQKYRIYNVFPWEFFVHLCIVIFTTLQICSMTETTGAYSRN